MNLKPIIVVVCIPTFFLGGAFAQDTVLKEFSGSGGKNTRLFTVKDGWETQWDAKGNIFQLYLYTANGNMTGVPANQKGSGKGTSFQPKAVNTTFKKVEREQECSLIQ